MLDRVTQSMSASSTLRNITDTNRRLAELQEQMSSLRQLNRPSDDPAALSRIMRNQESLDQLEQHQRNITTSRGWLEVADGALQHAGELLERIRTLTLQGANGANGPTERAAIADELTQLLDAIKTVGNSTYNGEFVFAGSQVTTRPYQQGAVDTYSGDAGSSLREIAPSVSVAVNIPGQQIFGDGTSGLIRTVRDVIAHLQGGTAVDLDTLRTTDLQALDTAREGLNSALIQTGVMQRRFDVAQSRLSEVIEATQRVISTDRDADLAQTYIQYSQQSAAFQAALKSGARVMQPSLLDYL